MVEVLFFSITAELMYFIIYLSHCTQGPNASGTLGNRLHNIPFSRVILVWNQRIGDLSMNDANDVKRGLGRCWSQIKPMVCLTCDTPSSRQGGQISIATLAVLQVEFISQWSQTNDL